MGDIKPIGKDATGYEILTEAMKELLNQYPGLNEDETIKFEELKEDSGIAFSADSGALVFSEKEDIIGNLHQVCQYPFFVVYRTASEKERQKISVQKFLDSLGKWICREPVVINGQEERLIEFPDLSGGRIINRITRDNSYGLEPQENGVQDWLLDVYKRQVPQTTQIESEDLDKKYVTRQEYDGLQKKYDEILEKLNNFHSDNNICEPEKRATRCV